LQALKAATSWSAESWRQEQARADAKIGSLRAGNSPTSVVVSADPLSDISHTRDRAGDEDGAGSSSATIRSTSPSRSAHAARGRNVCADDQRDRAQQGDGRLAERARGAEGSGFMMTSLVRSTAYREDHPFVARGGWNRDAGERHRARPDRTHISARADAERGTDRDRRSQ